MHTRILKWGNSLGLRIPQAFVGQLGLQNGSEVRLRVREASLVVEPVDRSAYDLDALLGEITTDNLHCEADFGPLFHYREPR